MELLTVKEVAEKLGISVRRVHQLIKAERLPAQKLGFQYVVENRSLPLVAIRPNGRPPKKKESPVSKLTKKNANKPD